MKVLMRYSESNSEQKQTWLNWRSTALQVQSNVGYCIMRSQTLSYSPSYVGRATFALVGRLTSAIGAL